MVAVVRLTHHLYNHHRQLPIRRHQQVPLQHLVEPVQAFSLPRYHHRPLIELVPLHNHQTVLHVEVHCTCRIIHHRQLYLQLLLLQPNVIVKH